MLKALPYGLEKTEATLLAVSAAGLVVATLLNGFGVGLPHRSETKVGRDVKPLAVLAYAERDVKRRPAGLPVFDSAGDKQIFYKKDEIFTGKGSAARIEFKEQNAVIELGENTFLTIDGGNEDDSSLSRLVLGNRATEPKTLTLNIGGQKTTLQKGTQLKLVKDKQGGVSMAVLAGKVEIATAQKKDENGKLIGKPTAPVAVRENQVLKLDAKGTAVEPPKRIAVTLVSPPRDFPELLRGRATLAFKWQGDDNQAGYLFEVARDRSFKQIIESRHLQAQQASLTLTAAGSYFWRVHAVGAGLEAAIGEERSFTLVADTPPVLRYPPDGQRITFLDDLKHTASTAATDLDWIGDGSRFQVDVARDAGFQDKVASKVVDRPPFRTPDLGQGRYYWRVRRADAALAGSAGFSLSRTGQFEVAPVPLPKPPAAASPANGQRLTLTPKQTAVTVSWTDPAAGAVGGAASTFELEASVDAKFPPKLTTRTTVQATNAAVPVARPGSYYWRLRTIDHAGRKTAFGPTYGFEVVAGALALASPATGSKLQLTKEKRTVALAWQPVALATSYRVRVAKTKDLARPVTKEEAQGTSLAWDDGETGTFYWRVEALNDGSVIASSAIQDFRVLDLTRYPAPELLAPKDGEQLRSVEVPLAVKVSWKEAGEGSTYRLEFATGDDFKSVVQAQSYQGATQATVKLPAGALAWRVATVLPDDGRLIYSAVRHLTIQALVPLTSPVLAEPLARTQIVLEPGETKVGLSWQEPQGLKVKSYEVQVSGDAAFDAPAFAVATARPTAKAALTPGAYLWRVRILTVDGRRGPWSDAQAFAVKRRLPPPGLVGLAELAKKLHYLDQPTDLDLAWAPLATAKSYKIEVLRANGDVVARKTTAAAEVSVPVTEGRYSVRLAAVDAAGLASDWSAPYPLVVRRDPPLGAPGVDPDAVRRRVSFRAKAPRVALEWDDIAHASKYEVQLANDKAFPDASTTMKATREPRLAVALDQGVHYWRVRTLDATGRPGTWSDGRTVDVEKLTAVPVVTAPTTGAKLTFDGGDDRTVAFHWQRVADLDKYRVVYSRDPGFKSGVTKVAAKGSDGEVTLPGDGRFYWYVEGENTAENVAVLSAVHNFTIDTLVRRADPVSDGRSPLYVYTGYDYRLAAYDINTDGPGGALSSSLGYTAQVATIGAGYRPAQGFGVEGRYSRGTANIPRDASDDRGQGSLVFHPSEAMLGFLYRRSVPGLPGLTAEGHGLLLDENIFKLYAAQAGQAAILQQTLLHGGGGGALDLSLGGRRSLEASADALVATPGLKLNIQGGQRFSLHADYRHMPLTSLPLFMAYGYDYTLNRYRFSDANLGINGTLQTTQYHLNVTVGTEL